MPGDSYLLLELLLHDGAHPLALLLAEEVDAVALELDVAPLDLLLGRQLEDEDGRLVQLLVVLAQTAGVARVDDRGALLDPDEVLDARNMDLRLQLSSGLARPRPYRVPHVEVRRRVDGEVVRFHACQQLPA